MSSVVDIITLPLPRAALLVNVSGLHGCPYSPELVLPMTIDLPCLHEADLRSVVEVNTANFGVVSMIHRPDQDPVVMIHPVLLGYCGKPIGYKYRVYADFSNTVNMPLTSCMFAEDGMIECAYRPTMPDSFCLMNQLASLEGRTPKIKMAAFRDSALSVYMVTTCGGVIEACSLARSYGRDVRVYGSLSGHLHGKLVGCHVPGYSPMKLREQRALKPSYEVHQFVLACKLFEEQRITPSVVRILRRAVELGMQIEASDDALPASFYCACEVHQCSGADIPDSPHVFQQTRVIMNPDGWGQRCALGRSSVSRKLGVLSEGSEWLDDLSVLVKTHVTFLSELDCSFAGACAGEVQKMRFCSTSLKFCKMHFDEDCAVTRTIAWARRHPYPASPFDVKNLLPEEDSREQIQAELVRSRPEFEGAFRCLTADSSLAGELANGTHRLAPIDGITTFTAARPLKRMRDGAGAPVGAPPG